MSKLKTNEVVLISPNGLVEKTLGVSDGGVVSIPATTLDLVGGQIKFPATQVPSSDPNTLDDYEEGTFTPVPIPGSGSITTYSGSGHYTKIGNVVTVAIDLTITNIGTASGSLKITGLPFQSKRNFQSIFGIEQNQSGLPLYGYIYITEIQGIKRLDGTAVSWSSGMGIAMLLSYIAN